jgi:hypothetical protein
MTTKTKPKPAPSIVVIPVTVRPNDRDVLLECLEVHEDADPAAAADAMRAIEEHLTLLANRVSHQMERPLPTHVIAALEPLAAKADELAMLCDPGRYPPAVLRELGDRKFASGELWIQLIELSVAVKIAMYRFASAPRGTGQHIRQAREATEETVKLLAELFTRLRSPKPESNADPKEYSGSLREFLTICSGYLPAMPNTKKQEARAA